jgi:Protein of unknown function (DUF3467)
MLASNMLAVDWVMRRTGPSRKSARVARPLYANYFEVGHTAFEFVIEFGDTYVTKPRTCHTRIVTSPVYALELLDVLKRAVRRYESRFGPATDRRSIR